HEGLGRCQWGFVDEVVVIPESAGARGEHSNEKQYREASGMFHRTIFLLLRCSACIFGRYSSNPGRSIRENVSFFPYSTPGWSKASMSCTLPHRRPCTGKTLLDSPLRMRRFYRS